jgi:hypothetical protein
MAPESHAYQGTSQTFACRLPVTPSDCYHAYAWQVSPVFFAQLRSKSAVLPYFLLIFAAPVDNPQRSDRRLQTVTNFFPRSKAKSFEPA